MKRLDLWLDQYGAHLFARTVRELRSQVGNGHSRVSKMYIDCKDGRTLHVGYVIGPRWFTRFTRVEVQS